ncbi:MAG: hypothetical protein HUJ65_02525, partial [Oscillospiraceae bacterium]|nr:hypothetical protein [Oscillospiraceae bacterium]
MLAVCLALTLLGGCGAKKEETKGSIGIVVAIEMDAVEEKYGKPKETRDAHGYTVCVYENGDNNLYFINSGAGEINSAGAAQTLISDFDVQLVL